MDKLQHINIFVTYNIRRMAENGFLVVFCLKEKRYLAYMFSSKVLSVMHTYCIIRINYIVPLLGLHLLLYYDTCDNGQYAK